MQREKDSRPKREQGGDVFIGIDMGSSAVHYAVLDSKGSVVYSPHPISHFANPLGALREAWQEIGLHFDRKAIRSTSLTGSAAEIFPQVMNGVL